MIETILAEKLKRIFNFKKTSFNEPGESQEQECLFIQVETSVNTFRDTRQISRVTGKLHVFANHDKLPLGYFSKRIEGAAATDVLSFFFFDFEENAGRYLNIVERSLSFVFFFDGQYDPDVGTMNALTVESVE